MTNELIFSMKFAKVYPLYVQKAERKNRTQAEVDQVIRWLTGYSQAQLQQQIAQEVDFRTVFAQAPALNPNTPLIKVWDTKQRPAFIGGIVVSAAGAFCLGVKRKTD